MREKIVRPLAAGALCVCALIVGAKADCIGGAETTTAVNLRAGAGTGQRDNRNCAARARPS